MIIAITLINLSMMLLIQLDHEERAEDDGDGTSDQF